jgi:hypothetical protein
MSESNIILYTTPSGQVQYEDGSFWLAQKRMDELKNIYQSGELQNKATTRKIRIVQNEDKQEIKCIQGKQE